MKVTGMKLRKIGATLTVATLLLMQSGCSSDAATAGLVAAGTLGAVYVGSQVSTYSKVSVDVEIYGDGKFTEERSPAILRQQGGTVDPVLDPSPEAFKLVLQQLQPTIYALGKQTATLKRTIEAMAPLAPQAEDIKATVDDLQALTASNDIVAKHFEDLKSQYRSGALSGEFSDDALVKMSDTLDALRKEARSALERTSSEGYAKVLSNFVEIQAREWSRKSTPPLNRTEIYNRYNESLKTLKAKEDCADERIIDVIALQINDIIRRETDTTIKGGLRDQLSRTLDQMAVNITPLQLKVIEDHPPESTRPLVAKHLQNSGSLMTLVDQVAQKRAEVNQRTFAQLQNDFNLGAVRSEVMQALLTPDAIREITSPANAGKWQRMSYAYSRGRAGNHDAIIYLETLGLPILKSSAFDPTKFIVANGQFFRKAFAAAVDVFGLPIEPSGDEKDASAASDVSIPAAKTKGQLAKEDAKASQQKLLAALKAVLDADAALANATAPTTAANKAKADLEAAAAALGDAEASK